MGREWRWYGWGGGEEVEDGYVDWDLDEDCEGGKDGDDDVMQCGDWGSSQIA